MVSHSTVMLAGFLLSEFFGRTVYNVTEPATVHCVRPPTRPSFKSYARTAPVPPVTVMNRPSTTPLLTTLSAPLSSPRPRLSRSNIEEYELVPVMAPPALDKVSEESEGSGSGADDESSGNGSGVESAF